MPDTACPPKEGLLARTAHSILNTSFQVTLPKEVARTCHEHGGVATAEYPQVDQYNSVESWVWESTTTAKQSS